MSWLLFLDESGHDHKKAPYEVHGGFAIHARKLWPFILAVRNLEQSIFGANLREYGLEIKGGKLLRTRCFRWEKQQDRMDAALRRKHALNFLNNGKQKRRPRAEQFAAYGQACIAMAEGVIELLNSHDARIFAAIVPRHAKPSRRSPDMLRKDIVFLLERFFYFLEGNQEMGLLVMDVTQKRTDHQMVRCMERYFTLTQTGRQRTQWIVPVPLFVESDMAYGVQAADLCIYCLNWGWRLADQMTEPTRPEIEPFVRIMKKAFWHGDGYRDGKTFTTYGTFFVPDLYDAR
ncbi:MAG: DUF3800 domain-containing protein [Phycisphaeraceae bacterium]|nr:DUF3800 domain-containing protein [Phycisphaeraceae bacterium]